MDDKFLDWLEEQPYWIPKQVIDEEWPNVEFKPMVGVTMMPAWAFDDVEYDGFDNDAVLVPKKEWRQHYKKG